MLTLAAIIDAIQDSFGRMTTELERRLPSYLELEINAICRNFDFDFLTVHPDPSFLSNFPIADTTALLALPSLADGNWLAAGWFYTEAGVMTYPVYETVYEYEDSGTSDTYLTGVRQIPSRLMYVKYFDLTGSLQKHLHITDLERFMIGKFSSANQDQPYKTTISENGEILVYPIPDDYYIIQMQYKLRELSVLKTPKSSNRFLRYAPDLAIELGKLIAARYFRHPDEAAEMENKIFGNPQKPSSVRSSIIGGLASANRKRGASSHKSMGMYQSRTAAMGTRSGTRAHEDSDGYWPA